MYCYQSGNYKFHAQISAAETKKPLPIFTLANKVINKYLNGTNKTLILFKGTKRQRLL